MVAQTNPTPANGLDTALQIGKISVTPDDETFKKQVARGVELCYAGELLEIVLSRKLTTSYAGDPLVLYESYKSINPSPYLFFFRFRRRNTARCQPGNDAALRKRARYPASYQRLGTSFQRSGRRSSPDDGAAEFTQREIPNWIC